MCFRLSIRCCVVSVLLVACLLTQEARALATRFDNSLVSLGVPIRQLSGVNAIAQDSFGFIWLAGENGLARYDGTEFRLFQFDPNVEGSLPDSYVWQVAIDKTGYVWAVTSGGLCRFNHANGRFECDQSLIGELAGQLVSTVAFGDNNHLYATVGSRLFVLDLTTKKIAFWDDPRLASIDHSAMYHDILLEEDGIIWLGSSAHGLVHLDTKTGSFTFFSNDAGSGMLSSNLVNCLLRDSAGRLWVGTHGGGINVMEPGATSFVQLSYDSRLGRNARKASIMDITEDDQGMFWVSVDQDGVLVFDQNLQLVHQFLQAGQDQYSLLSNRTKAIFQDKNKDMWVGQLPFGVSFWNRNNNRVQTFQSDPGNPETVSDSAILSFLESRDGTIWVGTEGGLNAFNPETGKFKRYHSEPENPHALKANAVLSLAEDSNGDIWVGTWGGGLHRFSPKSGLFYRYANTPGDPHSISDDFIWSILAARDGTVWVGAERQGLWRYRSQTDDFISANEGRDGSTLDHSYVLALAENSEGSLWIGTYGGVFLYNRKTDNFRVYRTEPENPYGLASSVATSILVDSRDGVWLASSRGVSYRKKDSEKFQQITMSDGLPAQTVSSIVEDRNGNIWLATTNGVARMHPETFAIEIFSVENGFAGSTYNRNATLVDSKGRLYFGSTEGITAFYPEDIKSEPIHYPVWITGFRLLHKDVPIGGADSVLQQSILTTRHLSLEHSQNILSFDFVALNFRNPRMMNYAYKLDGFDSDWQHIKHRSTATYTNLDPGRYVLRVQAQAPGEAWIESDQTIAIKVSPPWWRTWWAYMIYTAMVVAAGFSLYAVGRLKKSSDSFREQAIRDPLTGIYNRAGLLNIAQTLYANPAIQCGVGVLIIDIDHFKRINDTRGHDAGDRIISGVVDVLRQGVRMSDHVGRWGGEEFVILCPGTTREGAATLAEKIRTSVAEYVFERDLEPLSVTISIGVAMSRKNEAFEKTLKRADELLYKAKESGRNCVVIAD